MFLVATFIAAGCGNSGDDDDEGSADTPSTEATDSGTGTTAAAGGEDEFVSLSGVPGVTDDEIRFSAFGTQANNPLGTCVLDCYTQGIEAYFAFRNSEGGVHGRDLVLSTVLDDELSNNQQRALEIVSANDTFAAFSATQIPSGWPDVAQAGIPLYTWSIHPAPATGEEGIFGYSGVICTTCTSRSVPYVASLAGATTIATLGYGVSPNSQECAVGTADSVELYADETGQSVGYINDDLAFGLPNGIGPEVTAMLDAGVDFISACIDLNGMKSLAQELERQGAGDIPMYHPNTYNEQFVAEAGDLFEGDYVSVGFRPFEADAGDSLLDDFTEWMGETGAEISEIAMIGWINADTAYQGLLDAGPEFSREAVIAATNQLTDYTAGGLIAPIDWSRQHEPPSEDDPGTHGAVQNCIAVVQVVGGSFELVGDPAAPFLCWPGDNRDFTEPVETNFE
jgi:hypothetical protein